MRLRFECVLCIAGYPPSSTPQYTTATGPSTSLFTPNSTGLSGLGAMGAPVSGYSNGALGRYSAAAVDPCNAAIEARLGRLEFCSFAQLYISTFECDLASEKATRLGNRRRNVSGKGGGLRSSKVPRWSAAES